MSDVCLNKCGKNNCNPVEQVRGKMKPEDHHMQFRRHSASEDFVKEHGIWLDLVNFRRDAYDTEDQGPENAHDMRISCSTCGKATGWDRVDIETTERRGDGDRRRVVVERDGNKNNIRQRWNDMLDPTKPVPRPVLVQPIESLADRPQPIWATGGGDKR